MKIFICTNKFQKVAAKISAFSFEKFGFKNIEILELEKNEHLMSKVNSSYLRNGKLTKFDYDLQSFTLLRFLPFVKKDINSCLIIDPDVFAIKNPSTLLNKIVSDNEFKIGCTVINSLFRSEVILLNNYNFSWSFESLIDDLFNHKLDYSDLINLKSDKYFSNIFTLPINLNHHDIIEYNTLLLHTSKRITQPWKEGLEIDFRKKNLSTFFLIKQKIKKILGFKYNNELFSKFYLGHQNLLVSNFIIEIFKEAINHGVISQDDLKKSVENKHISKKFYNKLFRPKNLQI